MKNEEKLAREIVFVLIRSPAAICLRNLRIARKANTAGIT
jgi:hypothetical protein